MKLLTHTFSVTRGGVANTLTNLGAYVQANRDPNIVAFQDIPATKAYQLLFEGTPDIREQDLLVSEADASETYLVVGVAKSPALRLQHTSVVARATWGD